MRKNEKPAVRWRRHFIILALAVIAGSAIGDFWAICRENGSFAWERVAVYQAEAGGPGTVKRLAGCGPRASPGR